MSSEINYRHDATGATLYAVVYQDDAGDADHGKVRDVIAGVWDDLAVADWDDYDIPLSESPAASYRYVGDFPTLAGGIYRVDLHEQAGASPDVADALIASGPMIWDGTAEVTDAVAGRNVDRTGTETITLIEAVELLLCLLYGKTTHDASAGELVVTGLDGTTELATITMTAPGNKGAPAIN